MSDSAETLYASASLRVTHFPRESDFVVVTFDHWEAGKSNFKEFSAGSFWAKRGYSQLHVGTDRNNWFLAPETSDVVAALREACQGYRSITTYGSSMAGYAALLFGGALKARRALAISPHFSIDPAKVPFETRWEADRKGLDLSWDRVGVLGGELQDAVIVYDPRQAADTGHVQMLQQHFPAWRYVPLPHGGHPAFQTLASAGRSALAAAALLDEPEPGAALLAFHRAARASAPTYWAMIAERNAHRPRVFLHAVNRCLSMRGTPGDLLYRLARSQIDRREPLLAALLMQAAFERTPQPPRWWHTTLASALEQVRRTQAKLAKKGGSAKGRGARSGTPKVRDSGQEQKAPEQAR